MGTRLKALVVLRGLCELLCHRVPSQGSPNFHRCQSQMTKGVFPVPPAVKLPTLNTGRLTDPMRLNPLS